MDGHSLPQGCDRVASPPGVGHNNRNLPDPSPSLAVLLGGVIVLALRRRGFAEPAVGKTHRQTSFTQAAYEDVLLSIARLDRSFENDEVDGADYDRARAALASRLAAVSRLRDTGS